MAEARACLSLREFVEDLESLGWLRGVDKPVDKNWEIACIGRWALESALGENSYALRFNRVIGSDLPVVIGLFGSRRHIARSLGVDVGELLPRWAEALARPIPPEVVRRGRVKDVVVWGDEVDLGRLPIPVWTPGRDRAPYLSSACVITADRKDRIPNLATYRIEARGPRRLGLFFGSEKQHGAMHLRSFEEHGEPMPIALALGPAPAVCYAAAAKLRYGVDEMTVAGGLVGAPIEIVRCETSELLVPADAEIVIEGVVHPGDRADEGPFGEALGYMEGVLPAPVIEVTCVTHREAPLFHGLIQQVPPSEGHLLMEAGLVGSLWHYLKNQGRIEGVTDLAIVPGAAGVSVVCASVRRGDRKSVEAVLRTLTLLNWGQKVVIVVDDDVDVRDPTSIFWALSSRVDFEKDVTTQTQVPLFQRDPAAYRALEEMGAEPGAAIPLGSKIVLDATIKADCMEVALPAPALMRRARESWHETGLPDLGGSSRLQRLLDHHGEGGIEYHVSSKQ